MEKRNFPTHDILFVCGKLSGEILEKNLKCERVKIEKNREERANCLLFHSLLKIVSRQKFVSSERMHELISENPQNKHNPDSFKSCLVERHRKRKRMFLNCVLLTDVNAWNETIVWQMYLEMCCYDGRVGIIIPSSFLCLNRTLGMKCISFWLNSWKYFLTIQDLKP